MRYLSNEWIAAADEAMAGAASAAPRGRLVIDQHVEGVTAYRITIERGACSLMTIENMHGEPADASFRQSAEIAHAVAEGTTDSHQAFLLGHIRFAGSIDLLIERRDALIWLESTLAPILAQTTFGDQ